MFVPGCAICLPFQPLIFNIVCGHFYKIMSASNSSLYHLDSYSNTITLSYLMGLMIMISNSACRRMLFHYEIYIAIKRDEQIKRIILVCSFMLVLLQIASAMVIAAQTYGCVCFNR